MYRKTCTGLSRRYRASGEEGGGREGTDDGGERGIIEDYGVDGPLDEERERRGEDESGGGGGKGLGTCVVAVRRSVGYLRIVGHTLGRCRLAYALSRAPTSLAYGR